MSAGHRYRAFVGRHEVAWELAFAALAVVFVLVGFAPETVAWATPLDMALTVVFVAEFASRLAVAPSRLAYLRGHWIDAIALIPTVRGVRILRLLRLLRLVRAFAGVGRAMTAAGRFGTHGSLVWLFIAWGAVMVLCSLGLFAAESDINAAIAEPYDALWWGIVTMTTVGYGDVYPVTPEGRLFASVLMILGIGLYSAITATVTSALLSRRSSADENAAVLRHLAALRAAGRIDAGTLDAVSRAMDLRGDQAYRSELGRKADRMAAE